MEDHWQIWEEYRRRQQEILEKRAAKAGALVRSVMKRMGQAPSPFRKTRPQPIDPARDLNDSWTEN